MTLAGLLDSQAEAVTTAYDRAGLSLDQGQWISGEWPVLALLRGAL